MLVMPPAEEISRLPMGYGGRFYGVYPALVTANADDSHPGLIEISLPWCPDKDGQPAKSWARLAVPMAGKERGHWFIPDVDDEVLVCFEAGDPGKPFIIGALWNGVDTAPEEMKPENNRKSITTRKGIKLIMDDTEDAVQLVLQTPGGHTLTLQDGEKDGAPFVRLEETAGNKLLMDKNGIQITDKNGHTVTMEKDGITAKHSGGHLATVTGSEVALRAGQSEVVVKDAEIALKAQSGAKLTLGASGITAEFSSSKVEIAATKVGVTSGAASANFGPSAIMLSVPPATANFAASGIILSNAPGMVKIGPDGVLTNAGPGMVRVGPDGVKLLSPMTQVVGPMFQVVSPMFQASSAMLQLAGVLQCASLVAPTVASPAISPGPTNKL